MSGLGRTPGVGWIRAAARLVPRERRADWLREWEGELAWAWRRLSGEGARGTPPVRAVLRLRLRAASCLIDAIHERREGMTMTGTWNDLRFALRSLLRSPGFTGVAVLTLALGIGANTAVFTLVDGVLMSPLPFPDADRLVAIQHEGRGGRDRLPVSTGLYLLYSEQVRSLAGIALHQGTALNLAADGEEPVRVSGRSVTSGFFDVLDVRPALGRAFSPEEDRPGAEAVVILSDGLWRSAFGADPTVIGRAVPLNGESRTVIGVMPPGFGHPDAGVQLYVPLVIDPAAAPIGAFSASGIGRLAPGATAAGLEAELEGVLGRVGELRPDDGAARFLSQVGLEARVRPLKEAIVGDVSRTLWILLGTVALVLLIACANVANLFMVRAEGRHRELALRVAVGASRGAVLRPFLAESLVLTAAGGALGIAVADGAVRVAAALAPTDIPRMAEVGIDLRVLGFTAAVSLLAAVLFGVFPIARYGRSDLAAQLREGGERGGTGGRSRHGVRNLLVVGQVALALVLLVGSGLMLRSFAALRAVDPGFDPEGVLTVRLSVPEGEVPGAAEAAGFFRQLIVRLAEQPGVRAAGAAQAVPLSGLNAFGSIQLEDHPRGPEELPVMASFMRAEAGYFETMGVDVTEGRALAPGDGADGTLAVVVSESFARTWWPDGSALGRRVRQGQGTDWYDIVGVVADTHQESIETPPEEMVYFPALAGSPADPAPTRTMDVVVRVTGDAAAFLPVLRREVWALNPRLPLTDARPMTDVLEASMARTSFTMVLLATAAGVALLLGMVGIYGVVSYIVSQRTREIGLRMALGASGGTVRGMVVRQGAALAGAGVLVGLAAAAALSRVMSSLLFGVGARDPLTYAAVAATLGAVALLASWLPARRAAGVDPAVALRSD